MIEAGVRVPTSAVVWIPAESLWEPIQAVRRRFDRHLVRWMPHVTLLYPFRPRERFAEAEAQLREACAELPPFDADLREIRSFEHSPSSFTIWVTPEPEAAFRELQWELQSRFPDCTEVGQYPGGYTPHLSLGQSHDPRELRSRLEDLRKAWSPIRARVGEVALIAREGEKPFIVDRVVSRGASRP